MAANETGFGIATSYGQTLADLVALNPEVSSLLRLPLCLPLRRPFPRSWSFPLTLLPSPHGAASCLQVNIDLLQVGDVLLIPPFDSECDDGPPTMEEEVPPAEDEEAAGTADEESTSTEEEQNTEEQAAAEEEVAAAEEEQAAADEEQNADEGDNNNNKKDNKKGRKKGDRNRN